MLFRPPQYHCSNDLFVQEWAHNWRLINRELIILHLEEALQISAVQYLIPRNIDVMSRTIATYAGRYTLEEEKIRIAEPRLHQLPWERLPASETDRQTDHHVTADDPCPNGLKS